jgi:hypothetical protein
MLQILLSERKSEKAFASANEEREREQKKKEVKTLPTLIFEEDDPCLLPVLAAQTRAGPRLAFNKWICDCGNLTQRKPHDDDCRLAERGRTTLEHRAFQQQEVEDMVEKISVAAAICTHKRTPKQEKSLAPSKSVFKNTNPKHKSNS